MGKTLSSCLYETTMLALHDNDLKEILKKQELSTVAIYGLGMLGKALYELLNKNGINIAYGIDRDANKQIDGLKIIPLQEELLETVDAIIITPVGELSAIRKELSCITTMKLIDVDAFLDELMIATSTT